MMVTNQSRGGWHKGNKFWAPSACPKTGPFDGVNRQSPFTLSLPLPFTRSSPKRSRHLPRGARVAEHRGGGVGQHRAGKVIALGAFTTEAFELR